jgi:hypothetical protein
MRCCFAALSASPQEQSILHRPQTIASYSYMINSRPGWISTQLFSLAFLDEACNAVLLGPNGIGKSMILKNLAHHALVHGNTVAFTTASDMLADLAAQDSSSALARRFRRWTLPRLLCIDEVGYLSYNSRYADLLFEVVTRRYETGRPIVVSTNKAFNDWSEVFPHAACTVRRDREPAVHAALRVAQSSLFHLGAAGEASQAVAMVCRSRRSRRVRCSAAPHAVSVRPGDERARVRAPGWHQGTRVAGSRAGLVAQTGSQRVISELWIVGAYAIASGVVWSSEPVSPRA